MAEARSGRRFPLNLPIHLREGATSDDVEGTTKNVSAAGVYIKAEAELEVGSNIEFDITLPADVIGSEQDVTIRCQGRVVRTELAAGAAHRRGQLRGPHPAVPLVGNRPHAVRAASGVLVR